MSNLLGFFLISAKTLQVFLNCTLKDSRFQWLMSAEGQIT